MKALGRFIRILSFHRVVRVRHRHILTRNNRLRLRYVIGCLIIASLSLSSFFASISASVAFAPQSIAMLARPAAEETPPVVTLASYPSVAQEESAVTSDEIVVLGVDEPQMQTVEVMALPDSGEAGGSITPLPAEFAQEETLLLPREEIVKIDSGDTLAGALQEAGVSDIDAYNAVKAMAKHFDPRAVKAGQAVAVRLEPGDQGLELAEMNLKIDPIKEVVVEKMPDSGFESALKEKKVVLQTKAAKASIETSLYGSAARAGIPASVVAEMIRIYSYQVDFQRDIREGDKVEIMYETYETEDGDFARYGNVLYANLIVSGKEIPVYRFEPKEGVGGYYSPDGRSTKKSLMRTPVDGAHISSGFGMRRHPVLGYNKMHKGVDFAAPRGTPIYAAGDGTIEFSGRYSTYGNYIRIKHTGSMKTAYAHMHKFAKGMGVGKKVKQGDIIGYVGTTGRSTGPHLHYEVIKNGTSINPGTVNEPMGQVLAGRDLQRFKGEVASIKQQYATMTEGMKFAGNFTAQ